MGLTPENGQVVGPDVLVKRPWDRLCLSSDGRTCPPEKSHPDGGVKLRATKHAVYCPIQMASNGWIAGFFTTSRGISR